MRAPPEAEIAAVPSNLAYDLGSPDSLPMIAGPCLVSSRLVKQSQRFNVLTIKLVS